MEIAGLVPHHARYSPQATAVVCDGRRLSWREFDARANALGHALIASGVDRGDRVATVLANCLELLDIYWACARIGAVVVPLSPLLMADGLRSLLGDAAPTALFAQPAALDMLRAVRPAVPSLKLCVLVGGALEKDMASYADFVAGRPQGACAVAVAPDEPCNIMYTSGTTGLPKGIVHTHRIRAAYGTLFANAWRMTPHSVVLHTGAIVFNGAFVTLMPAFTLGATYVLHKQFDAAALIETCANERVTHLMLVPAQIAAVLSAPTFSPENLASVEVLLSLGAPLPVAQKEQLEALLPGRFHELYGLTEGFVTILDRADAVKKRGSVGVPPPFFEMRILREDGDEAGIGEVGEIVGRGPLLMPGYYRQPDLTAQAIRDGWLHTGDLGHVDADGYLYLVDRKKDMIDSGGVKVYPHDVEEVIARHPDVIEAVVFGIPDEKWGETPAAAVRLKVGAGATAEELRAWVNERVGARYQRLSRLDIMADFPRNVAGKTLRRELREPFWSGRAMRI
jgi:acyl-CoA synthetase (AMP-forming)/AMP-acid ligase II